jgi:GntR family transcriptional regulator
MSEAKTAARYLQIVSILQARITSGLYPVGALLPTEAELCEEFAVSRYTVREALRRLIGIGLVSRRQGSGTMVLRADAKQNYFFSLHSLSELFQHAMDTHFEVTDIAEIVLDAELADGVGGKRGARWTVVSGLRSVSPGLTPFVVTKSYIPGRFSWIISELPQCVGPFFAHIERRANEPITKAEQRISAVRMPPEVSTALGLPDDELSLLLLRRYMSEKGTLVASYNWHIASDFTYRMAIKRDNG